MIQTETEYKEKLARLEVIFLSETHTKEGEELERLVKEISEYEDLWFPIGEEEIKASNLKKKELNIIK